MSRAACEPHPVSLFTQVRGRGILRSSAIAYRAKQLSRVDNVNGGKGIYVGGTLISILISLALYFTGKRETAIFVGLWAPTILNLGQSLLEED